jgi:putative long chain acyl-CoA synthase
MPLVSDLLTRARHVRSSLVNTAKLVSGNRFTAPYHADYEVAHTAQAFSLRRYTPTRATQGAPVLLIPPLMVTPEIYDMAPEQSAVAVLRDLGHDIWAVDFGAPEDTPGGLEKTVEDHVLAISQAIDEVAGRTGASVHLIGYSQGGMFAYQTAAFRRCRGVASIITLGSPVDLLRNFPVQVHTGILANLLHSAEGLIRRPLELVPGLPGKLTSIGFKLASPRQELKHFLMMLRFLDDEEELARLEPSRRFLGGEGFIAWPGAALRGFVNDFVVHNRMVAGGFLIDGQAVSLSDLSVPILYVYGRRDEFARPGGVRAIQRVVPHEEVHGLEVDAGHLGLVVGTRAREEVWPTVDAWLRWREQGGPRPAQLDTPVADAPAAAPPSDLRSLLHFAQRTLWHGTGKLALDVTSGARWARWQLPRVLGLLPFWDSAPMSIGRTLAEQAAAIPDHTCFLWEGRASSYAEVDARTSRIAGALHASGLRAGQNVGLLMENHVECLIALAALSRIGAVPVLINPAARGTALQHALRVTSVQDLILAPGSRTLSDVPGVRRLLIGAGGKSESAAGTAPPDTLDLDALEAELPAGFAQNPGRAADLAFLLFTSGTTGQPKAARVSNRRWLMAATGAAAGCDLAPTDTVYCCLPIHHGTGLLLAVGGALIGGSRLALAPRFSTRGFWEDVRRTGATVVFYVGELCRYLISAPPSPLEKTHAVRLFVGNGMRPDVWRELLRRFGRVGVLEFYASTEGNIVMSNLTGEKIGSVGRVPFGVVRTLIVRYDPETETYPRDPSGFLIPAAPDEPGMLLAEIKAQNPFSRFDGYTDTRATEAKILRDVMQKGDAWFISGDLLREDADGDHWFVDRVGDTFRWKGENVSTEQVAGVLGDLPFVEMCAVYGVRIAGQEGRAGTAAIRLRPGTTVDPDALFLAAEQHLIEAARPRFVRTVEDFRTTESLKIVKGALQNEGIDLGRTGPLYVYDKARRTYSLVETQADLEARLGSL